MVQHWFNKLKLALTPASAFEKQFSRYFGFRPKHAGLYQVAFAHRSAPRQHATPLTGYHNERLEFLGDAVLSSILADVLFYQFPEADEGALTRMRSDLAKRATLNEWSEALGIPQFLRYDQSLNQNPQCSRTLYGNAFEALIGAMYLDQGYGFTHQFLVESVLHPLVDFQTLQQNDTDYKSQLTEWAQQQGWALNFHLDDQYEAETKTIFRVSAWVDGEYCSSAEGYRKKAAEQEASRKALQVLQMAPAS